MSGKFLVPCLRLSILVMNPRYPGYPNTRVFLPHFSPRYPEVNTRVVWVVDFWPNLHVFSIFFTKSSEILCDYSYMIFSKSYNQVQIQNCQKIVSFWGKKILNSNFLIKNIHNLNNFKVINGYPGTWVPTSQTDGYPSFTTRTWVYHHYLLLHHNQPYRNPENRICALVSASDYIC